MSYVLYLEVDHWYWELWNAKHQCLAKSPVGFRTRAEAIASIQEFRILCSKLI